MRDLPDVLDVGNQTHPFYSASFGTDWREGKCWRCRETPTTEPLETCGECREELTNG